MTALAISARDRRVLVLGVVVVTVLLVVGRGVPALLARGTQQRQRAAVVGEQATRAEWSVREADRTRRALAQVRTELATFDSALVSGAVPSAASAALAELVSDAASSADARIASIQLAADTLAARPALARVSARVSVSGDLMSIAQLIQMLEEGPQLLAVRELSVAPSQPGIARGQVETLQAEMLVEGLFRREPAGAVR
jgi:hypothetical protein